MNIIRFLLVHWDSVIVIAAMIAGVIALYVRGETKILEAILFRLVTEAEREYGSGTGELKKAAVIEWAYSKMPAVLKLILTQKKLETLINRVLDYAKTKWAANPQLQVYIKPPDPAPTETEE